jgi:exopolyphosphatase/guanosine-5'-triphosphate,3'-diphosphate pyrophosphatase
MKTPANKILLQHAMEFAGSLIDEKDHCQQVCGLSCMLFDELQPIHQMGNTERIWLQTAALLHDVGKSVGGKDHNKLSRDIIIKTAKLPLEKNERKIIGTIARYHRGAFPSRCHKYYGRLDTESRYYVRKLAALLRLADGLDGNHKGSVISLTCEITDDNIIIRPQTKGSFNPQKAIGKSDLFEDVFGRKVVIIEELQPIFPSADIESSDYTDWQY